MSDKSSGQFPEPAPNNAGLHLQLDATRLTLLLGFIYSGSQAGAVDMIEEELAELVLRLKRFYDFGPAGNRGRMLDALRQLRDFRSRNPLAVSERNQTSLERWKEAQEILDELG